MDGAEEMNLTSEQRGEVKPDIKPDSKSSFVDADQKPSTEDQEAAHKRMQVSLKAYYLELYKHRNKTNAGVASEAETKSERHVGMKSKHEEDDEVEWEEAETAVADAEPNEDWNTEGSFDGADGHVGSIDQVNKAVENKEDDIDWEDG